MEMGKDQDRSIVNTLEAVCHFCAIGMVLLLIPMDFSYVSAFSCLPPSAVLLNLTNPTCTIYFLPLTLVLIAEGTQFITILPGCPSIFVVILRIVQLAVVFTLKASVIDYTNASSLNQLTPAYIGYAVLCGHVMVSIATDIPGTSRQSRYKLAIVIAFCTASATRIELVTNKHQIITSMDLWIFLCAGVLVIPFVVFAVIKKLKCDLHIVSSTFGFVVFIYLLVPSLPFEVGIQVFIVLVGVSTYISFAVLLLAKALHLETVEHNNVLSKVDFV